MGITFKISLSNPYSVSNAKIEEKKKKGPNRDLNAGPRTGSPEARIIPNYSLVEIRRTVYRSGTYH